MSNKAESEKKTAGRKPGKKSEKPTTDTSTVDKSKRKTKAQTEVSEPKPTNQITRKAGLIFNVLTVKKYLINYYKSRQSENLSYSGGQVALTALLEKLYCMILSDCSRLSGKNSASMKDITADLVQKCLLENDMFRDYYLIHQSKYDRDLVPQICISRTELDVVANTIDKLMVIQPMGYNLLSFILMKAFNDVANAVPYIMDFAGKKMMNQKVVMAAVNLKFPTVLASELNADIVRVMKLYEKENENEKDEDEDDVAEQDGEGSDKDKPKKGDKGKNKDKGDKDDKDKGDKDKGDKGDKGDKDKDKGDKGDKDKGDKGDKDKGDKGDKDKGDKGDKDKGDKGDKDKGKNNEKGKGDKPKTKKGTTIEEDEEIEDTKKQRTKTASVKTN